VKIFLPGASPDGSTVEEIAITCSNSHHNLTKVLAVVVEENGNTASSSSNGSNGGGSNGSSGSSGGGCDGIKGLVMVLVRGQPMADRPTSQHLLRCRLVPCMAVQSVCAELGSGQGCTECVAVTSCQAVVPCSAGSDVLRSS
jgi:hypothetical protein